jgi:ethanolamine utilization protein EutP (predicted NTPase)
VILVLTKADLLSDEEIAENKTAALKLVQAHVGDTFFVTSAVSNRGIDDLFTAVAEMAHVIPEKITDANVNALPPKESGCGC